MWAILQLLFVLPLCSTASAKKARVSAGKVRFLPYKLEPTAAREYGPSRLVTELFQDQGYNVTTNDDWDILWTHKMQEAPVRKTGLGHAKNHQVTNHCDVFDPAGHKSKFAEYVRWLRKIRYPFESTAAEWERPVVAPLSFNWPVDRELFTEHLEKDTEADWIIKDATAGWSEGIDFLFHNETKGQRAFPDPHRSFGIQRVIHKPLLLDGRKCHLRMYLMITSWQPIRAFLHERLIVSLAKEPYNTLRGVSDGKSFNVNVHLTLNDHRSWSEVEFWPYIESVYGSSFLAQMKLNLFSSLRELVGNYVAYLRDFRSELRQRHHPCLDNFGLDVMFDERGRAFILEANAGPNLGLVKKASQADYHAKSGVIRDLIETLTLLHQSNSNPPITFDDEFSRFVTFYCAKPRGAIVQAGSGSYGGQLRHPFVGHCEAWLLGKKAMLWQWHQQTRSSFQGVGDFSIVLPDINGCSTCKDADDLLQLAWIGFWKDETLGNSKSEL